MGGNFYSATRNCHFAHGQLQGDHQTDVCVIGGGFSGVSAALALAERGYQVVLLEAETIGFGASGRNGGQLIPGLRWSMPEIFQHFGADRGKQIYEVVRTAQTLVQDRIKKHSIDCDLKSGHFAAAHRPQHFDDMCREVDFLRTRLNDDSVCAISRADVHLHVGASHYFGGIYDSSGGHFHPLNYVLGLANAARLAGVSIFENSRVLSINEGSTPTVVTPNGSVSARYIVLACDTEMGAIDREIGGYAIPIMNYNVATAPLSDNIANKILPSDASVADSRFVLNYFRLSADKRLIFGGGERYSATPPHDITQFVRPYIASVFPALRDVQIDYGWGGAVGVTMNRLPHLGRRKNIFFAHGFSGHGALTTTLAGELMAEALSGAAERFDMFASLPHRKFPGGKHLRKPLAALGLLWFALRDRL